MILHVRCLFKFYTRNLQCQWEGNSLMLSSKRKSLGHPLSCFITYLINYRPSSIKITMTWLLIQDSQFHRIAVIKVTRLPSLKWLIQHPDINCAVSLTAWSHDSKCQLSWECRTKAVFFSGLFAQRLSERSSPGRMKCRDTDNVLREE